MYYFIDTKAKEDDAPLMVITDEMADVHVGDIFQAPNEKVYRVVQRAIVTRKGEKEMEGRVGIAYQIMCRDIADEKKPQIEVVQGARF